MDFDFDKSQLVAHVEKLPLSLKSRITEMNASVAYPVEGYVTWLKYVVANIFRVVELNKVLQLQMSAGFRVTVLQSITKQEKLKYIEHRLERDERCYMSMKDKTLSFTAENPLPFTRSKLDTYINRDIHPGLIVKLVYWEVAALSNFRYSYHNHLLRKEIIDAMQVLPDANASLNPNQVAANILTAAHISSNRQTAKSGNGSPLKFIIKKESLSAMAKVARGQAQANQYTPGAGPSTSFGAPAITKIDCICGRNVMDSGPMMQCKECGAWQHARCILGPHREHVTSKKIKLCYKCRIFHADPFYVPSPEFQLSQYISVVKDSSQNNCTYYGQKKTIATYRRGFTIPNKAYRRFFTKDNRIYLALACLLVEDKIQNRIHLPKNATVLFNNRSVKVYSRCSTKDLSDNGRDLLVDVTNYALVGHNEVVMTTKDTRSFVLVVQMYQDESPLEVKKRVNAHADTSREDVVKRCKNYFKQPRGGDLGFTSMMVSLMCPLSGMRMKTPVKAVTCKHPKCFDLDAFLNMTQKTKKWQCPHCSKPFLLSDLEVDPYMREVISLNSEDVEQIEINDEGKWRPHKKGANEGAYFDYFESAGNLDDGESESEIDEAEEMRRAIAESGIKKRPRPAPVVVSLLSSDEEEEEAVHAAQTLLPAPRPPPAHRVPPCPPPYAMPLLRQAQVNHWRGQLQSELQSQLLGSYPPPTAVPIQTAMRTPPRPRANNDNSVVIEID